MNVLRINEVNKFINIINCLNDLIKDDISLVVTNKRLFIKAIDPANVCMSMVEYKNIEVDSDNVRLSFNLSDFKNSVSKIKSNDVVLEISDKLEIKSSDNKKKYILPLIATDVEDMKIPELDYKNNIEVLTKELKDGINDITFIADFVLIKNSEELELSNSSNIKQGNSSIVKIRGENDDMTSGFSSDYLNKIINTNLGNKIHMSLSNDYPLRIKYIDDSYDVIFILAPRMRE